MKNISIVGQTRLMNNSIKTGFCVVYSNWRKTRYLWRSPRTNKIYEMENKLDASLFYTRKEALLLAEEYLQSKKSKPFSIFTRLLK